MVTGKIPPYTRAEVQKLINNAGGFALSTVSRYTDILVVGDRPGKTKLEAADLYGTQKMSLVEFQNILAHC